jgi:hypothetical protein
MQKEIRYDKVVEFIRELKSQGITRVAFSEINEKRPRQIEENILRVEDMVRVDILAYKNSTIFKCVLEGVNLDALCREFASQGFEVTRRSRNIT